MQPTWDDTDHAPAHDEVIAALGRVLDSKQFSRSPRARGFLVYVVTETLAGRGERLSERTIARGALQRAADFDGRDDASVRVQAVRIRKSLEDYYARAGHEDPLRITLARGSYVPQFTRASASASSGPTSPGVVVVMLTSSGDDPAALFARSMSESLVQSLARHTHITVVGPIDASSDASASAAAGGVTSILTGHVSVRDGILLLAVRLVHAASDEVLWSSDETVEVSELGRFETEVQWSREIASKLGDPSGLVIRQELGRRRLEGAGTELAARLAFYAFLDRETVESLTEAVREVDLALDAGVRTAPLLAMRAALANAMSMYDSSRRDTELDLAETLAREALSLDGSNAHAHLVLSWPACARGHSALAIEHAETAVRLAPYHPSYLFAAGMTICASGDWPRGTALIREAHRLHPGMSSHSHAFLALGHLVEDDYDRALAEASVLSADGGFVWGPLFRSMALSGLGFEDEARAEAARAREMRPDVMDDVATHLGALARLTDAQLERLVGLVDAVDAPAEAALPDPDVVIALQRTPGARADSRRGA